VVPGLETAVGLKEGALGMEATVTPPTPIRGAAVTPRLAAVVAAAVAIAVDRRPRVPGA